MSSEPTTTLQDPDQQSASAKKHFVPLENNPEVLNPLAHALGLSPTHAFHDIYSITDPTLLSFIPRPAPAMIALIPTAVWRRRRAAEDSSTLNAYATTPAPQQPVTWIEQTIGNACGLYALMFCLANGGGRQLLDASGVLGTLLAALEPLERVGRTKVLEGSEELERLHMEWAVRGDSVAPSSRGHVGRHFMAFVKGEDGRLWELESCLEGPVERGRLEEGEDVLSERALEMGVGKFFEHMGEDLEFSLTALAPALD